MEKFITEACVAKMKMMDPTVEEQKNIQGVSVRTWPEPLSMLLSFRDLTMACGDFRSPFYLLSFPLSVVSLTNKYRFSLWALSRAILVVLCFVYGSRDEP